MSHRLQYEQIINYLAEIATGNLSFTYKDVEQETDLTTKELMFGLLCLQEDLNLQRSEIASLNNFLQNILQSLSDLLFIINSKGNIVLINKQATLLLQSSHKDLIRKPIKNFLQQTSNKTFIGGLFTAEKPFNFEQMVHYIKLETFNDVPMSLIDKENQEWAVLVTAQLMENLENHNDPQIILMVKDGRQSRLLQELKEKQAQLIQASKLASMGELASGIAHELNNPLFAVVGLAELLQMQLQQEVPHLYPKLQSFFDNIFFASERMREIINHIRIFARQEKMTLHQTSINTIIQSALLLMKENLRLSNIDLSLSLDSDFQIECAPHRIEQVLINLLSNAKDALQNIQGNKSITIATTKVNNMLQLSITDTGSGIAPEHQDKLFDPFFSTKEIGKGTGLGLAISYGIIQEHQGNIRVQSEPNVFTTFVIELPLL